jgi:hypothetical protein
MAEIPAAKSLEHLPLRAILAFAVRCARRVQPLILAEPKSRNYAQRIDDALFLAEAIAAGNVISSDGPFTTVESHIGFLLEGVPNTPLKASSFADSATNSAVRAAITAAHVARAARAELAAEAEASRQATRAMNDVAIARAEAALQDSVAAAEAELEAGEAAQAVFAKFAQKSLEKALAAESPLVIHAADALAYGHFALDAWSKDKRIVEDYGSAAGRDQVKLSLLNLGNFPLMGELIDPSESGPLGPLWPEGQPVFLANLAPRSAGAIDGGDRTPEPRRLVLEAEVTEYADTEEVASALASLCFALNAYHIAAGGNGLIVDDWEIMVPEPTLVEAN